MVRLDRDGGRDDGEANIGEPGVIFNPGHAYHLILSFGTFDSLLKKD